MAAPDRLVWEDILRGVTILLVVMNHVSLVDMSTGANYEAVYRIASLCGHCVCHCLCLFLERCSIKHE